LRSLLRIQAIKGKLHGKGGQFPGAILRRRTVDVLVGLLLLMPLLPLLLLLLPLLPLLQQ